MLNASALRRKLRPTLSVPFDPLAAVPTSNAFEMGVLSVSLAIVGVTVSEAGGGDGVEAQNFSPPSQTEELRPSASEGEGG